MSKIAVNKGCHRMTVIPLNVCSCVEESYIFKRSIVEPQRDSFLFIKELFKFHLDGSFEA